MRNKPSGSSRIPRLTSALVGLCAALLVVAACGGLGASSGGGSGPSVDADASKAEFAAALEDVETIDLKAQTSGSADGATSRPIEAYAEAVSDWSGGKINIEIVYGNALASPGEIDDALADGRLDMAKIYPLYDSDRYPAYSQFMNWTLMGDQTPFAGRMVNSAAYLETAWETPEILREFEQQQVKLLLPVRTAGRTGLGCTTMRSGLEELHGAVTRVSIPSQGEEMEVMGGSPVSMPFSELFQALQRGTVDCVMTNLEAANLTGVVPEAPAWVIDSEVGFSSTFVSLGFGQNRWDQLPLAAQQLLHDRLDVYFEQSLYGDWQAVSDALSDVEEFSDFDADARDALKGANETILEQVRSSGALDDGSGFVERGNAELEKWRSTVVDDLGAEVVAYDDFRSWYNEDEQDLSEYMEKVREEVFAPHRPGS